MTALRFRCHPVAAEAALRTASRRIESIHAQVAETALAPLHRRVKDFRQFGRRQVVRHGREERVGKASELSVESSGLALLANTSARSSGLLSSTAGGDSGSELADVSCSVTRGPDVSESTDVIVSDMHFDSCFRWRSSSTRSVICWLGRRRHLAAAAEANLLLLLKTEAAH